MLPDPGRYEEHWRLTNVVFLLSVLLFLLIGILAHFRLFIVGGGVGVLIYILTVTVYRVAFRADSVGITFGANLLGLKFYTLHIPWPDIETIILYSLRDRERSTPGGSSFWISPGGLSIRIGSNPKVLTNYIGIKRRAGAPALAHGNQPSNCPDPTVPAGATRPIGGWRLDRDRLAAVIAVAAPDVRLVDDGTTDLTEFMK
jgi:hypothetical protein